MGKIEIISHWVLQAERDWKSALALLRENQFIHALFFSHLVIDKLLKAHWVDSNVENEAPRIHDLEFLYNQTNLAMAPAQVDFLVIINSWNLEGRYQDYKDKFFKKASKEYTEQKIKLIDELRLWLPSELQKKR
jgi:HEPN domain-containing protein